MRISDWSSDVGASDLDDLEKRQRPSASYFSSMSASDGVQVPIDQRPSAATQWFSVLSQSMAFRFCTKPIIAATSWSDPWWPAIKRCTPPAVFFREIGRASCRERVCQYV